MTPEYERLGFGGPDGERRHLGSPVPSALIERPTDTHVTRVLLTYGYRSNADIERVDPGSPVAARMLEDFLGIALTGLARVEVAEKVRRFTAAWGPLGLCRHRLPASHNPPPRSAVVPHVGGWCLPAGMDNPIWQARCERRFGAAPGSAWGRERIDDWLAYARQADAILKLYAALNRADPPNERDTNVATGFPTVEQQKDRAAFIRRHFRAVRPETRQPDERSLRATIGAVISEWLNWGGVSPVLIPNEAGAFVFGLATGWRGRDGFPVTRVGWATEDMEFEQWSQWPPVGTVVNPHGGGAFGVIAMQIAMVLSGNRPIAVCSHCGRISARSKWPREGERAYCDRPECRRARQAAASAATRRRAPSERGGPGRRSKKTEGQK